MFLSSSPFSLPMPPHPPPPSDDADACKREACALQRCLKHRGFDARRCVDAVAALRRCCAAGRLGVSVHCPASEAGWAGRGLD